jgi:predicted NBD/HSP70 family sugar kinase
MTGLPPAPHAMSPGVILALIRGGHAVTRNALIERTGLSRSTILQRLGVLLASGLVVEGAGGRSRNGGRPPTVLQFNEDAGLVLAADVGARHARVAVCDLGGRALVEEEQPIAIGDGPDAILDWLIARFDRLLGEAERSPEDVLSVGVGLPGPVDFATGRPINPPIMPGWDGYPVGDVLSEHYDRPALVDNDVNIMAVGEHRVHLAELEHLVFVKVATGIGAGVITNGQVYRGTHGAAGDIGHIRSRADSDVLCTCGNRGCVGALASGSAVARQLAAEGLEVASASDVVALVAQAEPRAIGRVRDAGRLLGEALASVVSVLAPTAIVIGGEMAEVHEPLLAGIRSRIYERALPLVTRELRIVPSRLGARAGIAGAATLAIEHLLAPEHVDGLIVRRTAGAPAMARR